MKPIIGVTPLFDDLTDRVWMRPHYLTGIQRAGGIPLTLPLHCAPADITRLVELCDGFLFTGGQDIAPSLYGQDTSPECGPICAARDALETALFDAVLARGKPVFGICRGCQLINVRLGGTLCQDIPAQRASPVTHRLPPPQEPPRHAVTLVEDTPLFAMMSHAQSLEVNSLHHQAIDTPAPALRPMAFAPDGLVEAVYMPDKPFVVGVQWHPELLYETDDMQFRLFQQFVAACETACLPRE